MPDSTARVPGASVGQVRLAETGGGVETFEQFAAARLPAILRYATALAGRPELAGTGDDLVVFAYRNLGLSRPTITRDQLVRVAAGVRALPVGYPWIGR